MDSSAFMETTSGRKTSQTILWEISIANPARIAVEIK